MSAATSTDPRLTARRAVEALRSGVPSRDAVAALGSGQGEIEDRVAALLDTAGTVRSGHRGLLLGGGFGSGKSHALEHLAHLALERGFVVSRVVISKETPLHDPVKVLRSAVESALTPDGAIGAVAEAAASLDPGSPAFTELLRWAMGGAAVDERFPLTLSLLPRIAASDEQFADAIVRFWSGDALGVAELRRQAREAGEGRRALASVPVRELAAQRFRFLARLFVAAGFQGWLVLFDEVELIGRYTLLQRAKSYAELANWLLPDADDPASPLVTVAAMTDDFDAAVLTERDDRRLIPEKLRAKQTLQWDAIGARAETGMRLIERDMLLLRQPDDAELGDAYQRLKALHGQAFGWDAPDVAGLERLGATRMRQYVRAWINEWDLVRLDPYFTPQTEVATLATNYAEDVDVDVDVDRGSD
ncbi:MAG: hypothetical protein QOD31_329 [Pseudonocardiales bacterium]|nr:hypothetical protein [Pseudonocardiales bacterium]